MMLIMLIVIELYQMNLSQGPKLPSLCIELHSEKQSIWQKLLKRNCSLYLHFAKNIIKYLPYTTQGGLFKILPFSVMSHNCPGEEHSQTSQTASHSSVSLAFSVLSPSLFPVIQIGLWFLFTFLNLQLVLKFFTLQGIQELAQQARIFSCLSVLVFVCPLP